jgi:hypothetical protein
MKTCSKCSIEKDESEFSKNKSKSDGLNHYCKKCYKEYYNLKKDLILKKRKKYYEENKEYCNLKNKKWRLENKEKVKELRKLNYNFNKEKSKEDCKNYNKLNREKVNIISYNWKLKNPEKTKEIYKNYRNGKRKETLKIWFKNKYDNDINFKLINNIRSRIFHALNKNIKSEKTEILLGCPISEFKNYIESQFDSGFTWIDFKNHKYHIDHIIPCAVYDLTDIEEQKKCFNFKNMRPSHGLNNLIKKDKIDMDLIKKHNIEHLLPNKLKRETSCQ